MLFQLSLGAVLVIVGTVLHVAALDRITSRVHSFTAEHVGPLGVRTRLGLVSFAALGVFVSHILQIWFWAMVFLAAGEFASLEPALYFSAVVFTTVGFGDIVATTEWRLLASCEAVAGFLLFGLSTAALFEVLREVRRRGGRWTPGASE